MKSKQFLSILLLLVCWATNGKAQTSLEEVVSMALKQNLSLKIKESDLGETKVKSRQSLANFLPMIEFSSSFTRADVKAGYGNTAGICHSRSEQSRTI